MKMKLLIGGFPLLYITIRYSPSDYTTWQMRLAVAVEG